MKLIEVGSDRELHFDEADEGIENAADHLVA
jgi:hypothetical protein